MRVLEFKTISPFFELCRDGQKPFDIRLRDPKDKRFRALSQLPYSYTGEDLIKDCAIKFTNPVTRESFSRRLLRWEYLPVSPSWVIMYLGEITELLGTEVR